MTINAIPIESQAQIYSAPRPPLRLILRGPSPLAAAGAYDSVTSLMIGNVSGQKVCTPTLFYQATGAGGSLFMENRIQ